MPRVWRSLVQRGWGSETACQWPIMDFGPLHLYFGARLKLHKMAKFSHKPVPKKLATRRAATLSALHAKR